MQVTFNKIKNKIVELQQVYIPHNQHLRPTSIYGNSKTNGVKKISSIPNCTTNLQVPPHLFNKLSPFTIYDKISETDSNTLTVSTNYDVYIINEGRLYSNNTSNISVISKHNELIGEISFQYKKEGILKPADNQILKQRGFIKPKYYKGTLFNMLAGGGAARGNFGHWLLDVIPRLHLLKKSGYFSQTDWFLVPQYQHDFQKQTMNYFGIKDTQVIEGKNPLHLQADCIVSSTHPRGERSFLIPQWIVDFYQNEFDLDSYDDSSSPKLVYISRKDSTQRNVENEDELIKELQKLGFKSVELSNYDFFGKIKLFRNASFIVSATGAGLTTCFFCKKNTKVLEFFSESLTHTHYYNISKMVGLQYDCLIFKSKNKVTNMKEGISDDINIDPQTIISKVKEMI